MIKNPITIAYISIILILFLLIDSKFSHFLTVNESVGLMGFTCVLLSYLILQLKKNEKT